MWRRYQPGDGSDEADHLACEGCGGDHLRLARRHQVPIALAHPQLALPSDFPHGLGQTLEPVVKFTADASLHAIAPPSFDQGPSGGATAGLCNVAAAHGGAAGMLGGRQAQIRHQLAWIFKAVEVSDLGHHRHGNDERNPAHRLNRRDHGCKAPAWQQIGDLPRQPLHAGLGIRDSVNILLIGAWWRDQAMAEAEATEQSGAAPQATEQKEQADG